MKMQWRMLALTSAVLLSACGKPNSNYAPHMAMPGDEDGPGVSALADVPANTCDPDDHVTFPHQAPMPAPAGRKGQWLVVTNHNHSSYWDGLKPLTLMQAEAYLHNCDAMILTDHDTMRGAESPEFQNPPHGLIMVKGMEWNAFREKGEPVLGHAGLLGLDGDDPLPTGATLDDMLSEATARHGTIIINHPFCRNNSWQQPKPDPRAHAVEIWNGWWFAAEPITHNDRALAWWDDTLKTGRHLAAIAGTDYHGHSYNNIYSPVNVVFAETPDQAGILAAIRGGHLSLTQSTTSGRLFLEADADGDGEFESIMGDSVAHPAAGTLNVRAHVLGGKGKEVVLYTAKGRQAILDVKSDDAIIPFKVQLGTGADYVRAELRAHPHLAFSMTAISNPIYVTP